MVVGNSISHWILVIDNIIDKSRKMIGSECATLLKVDKIDLAATDGTF